MKFPFVLRSRHEIETKQLQERVTRLEQHARIAQEKLIKATEKIDRMTGQLGHEQHCISQLEQLCEARLRDLETMRSVVADLRNVRAAFLNQQTEARIASSPYRGRAIPVILGIDVEPDDRVVDLQNPSWQRTTSLFTKLPEYRERLQTTAGGAPVRFTWFPRADPQVELANGHAAWALENFAEEWKNLNSAGDEIGLHMHPWRWDTESNTWCQDHGDETWLTHCLSTALNAFRQCFGIPPTCYRGGDRFLSNAVVRQLEAEGVRLDLTLERMPEVSRLAESEHGTGVIPDGRSIPPQAFRSSATDYRLPDPDNKSGLIMLPLTAYQDQTLMPWLPPALFEETLKKLLEDSDQLTHLAFIARSDIAEAHQWDDFIENSLTLARLVREGRLVFQTASTAWEQINAQEPPAAS